MKARTSRTNAAERKTSPWLRFLALLLGVYLLSWLPYEDQDETRAILSAAAVSAWLALRYILRLPAPSRKNLWRPTIAGFLAGLAVTPLALFLMAFKTGIHGHGSPDFTAEQIFAVIYGTPIWSGAGLLVGLGGGFLLKAAFE